MSPKQKALVVNWSTSQDLAKTILILTCVISDGANNISMIQAAEVGISISSEEGIQAINSSNYAMAQFHQRVVSAVYECMIQIIEDTTGMYIWMG